MPQVNITTSRKLDAAAKNDLQLEIGAAMPLLPGKNIGNTIISINDGVPMFRDGRPADAAFIDVRLYKASPEDSKSDFAKKMFAILNVTANIEPGQIYMNFIELEHWASNGEYR